MGVCLYVCKHVCSCWFLGNAEERLVIQAGGKLKEKAGRRVV